MKEKSKTQKDKKKKPAKKKATRLKILKAARKVFAQRAYHAASIRMIGKEAGIDYQLIGYYFQSKAELFEAVLADIVQEWDKANEAAFVGLEKMSPEAGLALYLDRMIGYSRKHSYAGRVYLLNMVQAQDEEAIPGYQAIRTFFERTIAIFKDRIPLQASDRDIEIFRQGFNTLILSYLGAQSYYAAILGMDADSSKYEKWLKDMLMALFLPHLKQLMAGDD
jgi:AcrR family transcriptional regulator